MKKRFIFISIFGILIYSIFSSSSKTFEIKSNNYYWSQSDITKLAPTFVEASKEFGVPASIMIAMAIHETGLGENGVGKSRNNLFGMTKGSLYPTPSSCTGNFECYSSKEDSIRDAARLLGSPKSYYKITNIIINNRGLDGAYEEITRSITAKWCASGCTYDAQTLLDDLDTYNLTQYDTDLKNMSVSDLKAILEKYYGENAITIPGYDAPDEGWNGKIEVPSISDDEYNMIYFNTSYTGDVTKGYIYNKYNNPSAVSEVWSDLMLDTDDEKVSYIISSVFLQGEKLYGDGSLHMYDFVPGGTDNEAPSGDDDITFVTDGKPLSCYTMVSSSFGNQESFRTAKHKGMDLAAPAHTKIFSVTDGKVVAVGSGCSAVGYYGNTCGGGYGNFVKIQASNGMYFIYAHMYTKPLVSTGQTVSKGQQIGVVGSSGSSTGNHLHFETRNSSNVKINPTPYSNYTSIPKC